ncbi:MAG TPA: 30S ribosomal protein S1 [Bacilli bacterium]
MADQGDLHIPAYKKGDTVKGKIVKIEDNQAFVDIGYKYDGIIPIREISNLHLENISEVLEIGQEVECKVSSLNDDKESLILSKRAVDSENVWEDLQARLDNKETFEAKVFEVVKGGLVIDLGVRGFVPASMVERHFVEDFSDYKGRTLKLKVKELDRENNKVILSQKDVLDEEYGMNKAKILSELSVNQEIDGTVQRLTPFGAFVDIGGIDGLVHVSEMSWSHIEKPSDVLKEGDKVRVKILKLDPATEKISLSLKATQAGPWEEVGNQFKIGDIVTGEVRRLVNFGAFIEIAPGVEGLVHISQISHRHIGTPHEVLKEGQSVSVKILDLNLKDKKVSLSIKETEDAPAPSERPERPDRQKSTAKVTLNNDNVSLTNQGLNVTLGDLFGDKFKHLK